jgi:hypothetical protein
MKKTFFRESNRSPNGVVTHQGRSAVKLDLTRVHRSGFKTAVNCIVPALDRILIVIFYLQLRP